MKTLLGSPTATTMFETANERSVAALRMLAETGRSPRLAMVGNSMLPLLRQPMVLELGPFTAGAKVGEVLVFAQAEHLVAHRVIGFRGDLVVTAGDNTPWVCEEVRAEQVVGKVIAVYADDQLDAKRLDDWLFCRRGVLKAYTRTTRHVGHLAANYARRGYRGLNAWRRVRRFPILAQALAAVHQQDKSELEAALSAVDPLTFLPMTRWHGCASILLQGITRLGIDPEANANLIHGLQKSSRATALKVILLRTQIANVVRILSGAGVDFALLKGAARIYSGDVDAYFHKSSDIDVFVKRSDLESAIAALKAAGYIRRASDKAAALYLAHHHHYAQLRAPGGPAIELHFALSRPGTLSETLDWDYLSRYLRTIEGPAGKAQCLNETGTAIHLATHAIGVQRLRDVYVLAQLMSKLNPADLSYLRSFSAGEHVEPIRLSATFLLAAQIAGIPWDSSRKAERYLSWIMRREDLPIFIRQRSTLVEIFYAVTSARPRLTRLLADLLPFLDRHAWRYINPAQKRRVWLDAAVSPFRLCGRIATNIIAFFYAKAMPRVDFPH